MSTGNLPCRESPSSPATPGQGPEYLGWCSELRANQSGPHGEAHQSRDVEDLQGFHQLCAMVFKGLVADFENRSDGLGGLALGQQLEDLALARGQLLERSNRAGDLLQRELLEELAGDFPAQVDFAANHAFEGRCQFGGRSPFEQVTGRPGFQSLQYVLVVGVHGEDDHAHLWKVPGDARQSLEAVCVEKAVSAVLSQGARTADLAGKAHAAISTTQMGSKVVEAVKAASR